MRFPFFNKKSKQEIFTMQTAEAQNSYAVGTGVKITPNKIKTVFSELDFNERNQLYLELDNDDTIASALPTRKEAILGLDWQIKANRSNTPKALELADRLADIFYNLNDFEDLLPNLMQGVFSGVSISEIEWELNDGLLLPKNFHNRPLPMFAVDKGGIKFKKSQRDLEALNDFGFIIHNPFIRNKAFTGLYEPLAYLQMFKHYSFYDFAEFLENYGQPIRIGKYPAFATKEEKSSLLNALHQLGHNMAGIIPESMAVDIINTLSNNNGSSFLSMVERCDAGMSKIILGQTLTSSSDGAGSYALGRIHNEVRKDILTNDAKKLAKTITNQLLYKIIALNFADVKKTDLPYFEFNTQDAVNLEYYANALPKLSQMGVKFPKRYINELLNIPPKADDDEFLEPAFNNSNNLKNEAKTNFENLTQEELKKTKSKTLVQSDYDLLDLALDNSLHNNEFTEQLSEVDKQLLKTLEASNSYDELQTNITSAFADLDLEKHTKFLNYANTIANLMGRF